MTKPLPPYVIHRMLDDATAWIDDGPWRSQADRSQAIEFRDRMAQAIEAKNLEAAEAWGHYFDLLKWLYKRDQHMAPLARIGLQVRDRLPAPGERATLYNPKKTSSDRKARDARIVIALREGRSPAEIAKAERVSTKTVERAKKSATS